MGNSKRFNLTVGWVLFLVYLPYSPILYESVQTVQRLLMPSGWRRGIRSHLYKKFSTRFKSNIVKQLANIPFVDQRMDPERSPNRMGIPRPIPHPIARIPDPIAREPIPIEYSFMQTKLYSVGNWLPIPIYQIQYYTVSYSNRTRDFSTGV